MKFLNTVLLALCVLILLVMTGGMLKETLDVKAVCRQLLPTPTPIAVRQVENHVLGASTSATPKVTGKVTLTVSPTPTVMMRTYIPMGSQKGGGK